MKLIHPRMFQVKIKDSIRISYRALTRITEICGDYGGATSRGAYQKHHDMDTKFGKDYDAELPLVRRLICYATNCHRCDWGIIFL